ncbi:MAG: penicillin acylase family protein, partial [Pricia sp.]
AYTQLENKLMDALFNMSHAENIGEFQSALPNIHAPGLNIMYGDSEGNVAWWATAQLYRIPDSTNTKIVYDLDGGLPIDREYLSFTENPQAVNPPWQYVYSANNQPDSIAGMLYPGYYLPENRALRIETLLDAKDDWDAESVRDMMNDVTSPVNPSILKSLLKQMDTKGLSGDQLQGLDKLQRWQGDYPLNSVEATLYHRWVYHLLVNTFEDELGPSNFDALMDTHLTKRLIAPLVKNDTSVWWDDVSTEGVTESRSDIVNASYREAWEGMQNNLGGEHSEWTWKRVHTLEHGHPMGQVEALRPFFNVGPFPVPGTREVINNMAFPYTEDGFYKVSSGPSTRRVIDFSDVENSMSILPTGQSGNPFSPHYNNQAEMFAKGEFRKMMMNKKEIEETAESVLTLIPAPE